MGQSFLPANIDKNEYLCPMAHHSGWKLMGHSWIGNYLMGAVMVRLCDESVIKSSEAIAKIPFAGTWANDRIVWAGQYMEENILFPDNIEALGGDKCFIDEDGDEQSHTLYYLSELIFNEITEQDDSCDDLFRINNLVLLNHDLKQYATIPNATFDAKGDFDGIVNPVSLLLAISNGGGSSDYHGPNEELCGVWAGNSLSISLNIPNGYILLQTEFHSDY